MRAVAMVAVVALGIAGCSATAPRADRAAADIIDASAFIDLPELEGRSLVQLGILVDSRIKEGPIAKGQVIGTVAPLPKDRGGPFQAQLFESQRRYAAGDRAGAAAVLQPLVERFEVDPFVLNAYARSIYWTDKPRAFEVYSRLVAQIDALAGGPAKPTDLIVHAWFAEAYWKKGTLHLDRREWRQAALEISRYLSGSGLATTTLARLRADPSSEQALQFLTEAYAELGEEATALRFARRTLQVAPDNTYIFDYVPREKVNDVKPH